MTHSRCDSVCLVLNHMAATSALLLECRKKPLDEVAALLRGSTTTPWERRAALAVLLESPALDGGRKGELVADALSACSEIDYLVSVAEWAAVFPHPRVLNTLSVLADRPALIAHILPLLQRVDQMAFSQKVQELLAPRRKDHQVETLLALSNLITSKLITVDAAEVRGGNGLSLRSLSNRPTPRRIVSHSHVHKRHTGGTGSGC